MYLQLSIIDQKFQPWYIINPFPPRPAKTGPFIILLCQCQTILLIKGEPLGGKGLRLLKLKGLQLLLEARKLIRFHICTVYIYIYTRITTFSHFTYWLLFWQYSYQNHLDVHLVSCQVPGLYCHWLSMWLREVCAISNTCHTKQFSHSFLSRAEHPNLES